MINKFILNFFVKTKNKIIENPLIINKNTIQKVNKNYKLNIIKICN
jgi:hypothetical protein